MYTLHLLLPLLLLLLLRGGFLFLRYFLSVVKVSLGTINGVRNWESVLTENCGTSKSMTSYDVYHLMISIREGHFGSAILNFLIFPPENSRKTPLI